MSDKRRMTVDCETTGKDWTTCVLHGIGVGYDEDDAEYYPADQIPESVIQDLADPEVEKIGHFLHGYDAKVIQRHGYAVRGKLHDTMVMWNLVYPDTELGLKYLAETYLGINSLDAKRDLDRYVTIHKAGHIGGLCALDLADPERPHTQVIGEYCKEDVRNTTGLFLKARTKLYELHDLIRSLKGDKHETPLTYYLKEALPTETVLFDMEYRGIRIDLDAITKVRDAVAIEVENLDLELTGLAGPILKDIETQFETRLRAEKSKPEAKAKIQAGVGKAKFSWGNNNHVGEFLYSHPVLPPDLVFKTDKGKYRTDKETLKAIRAELPAGDLRTLLEVFAVYKTRQKVLTTYTGNAKKGIMSKIRWVTQDGKIHRTLQPDAIPRIFPSYRQTTGTGRLASSNPNMQNLKKDSPAKRFFLPDSDGDVIDDADYSQIELVAAAEITGDSKLVAAYNAGEDLHVKTANVVFKPRVITKADKKERGVGKTLNFLTIFKGGAWRLQTQLKKDLGLDFEIEECQAFLDTWFAEYTEVADHLDSELSFFKEHKLCVSKFGRIRWLHDIDYGRGIEWIKRPKTPGKPLVGRSKHYPAYSGPIEKKNLLRDEFVKKFKRVPSEEDLGWLARKHYNHAMKAGFNQPIQSFAASLTKRCMVSLHRAGKRILNQVHDNLLVNRPKTQPEEQQMLERVMCSIVKLKVPITVEIQTVTTFHPDDVYTPEVANEALQTG